MNMLQMSVSAVPELNLIKTQDWLRLLTDKNAPAMTYDKYLVLLDEACALLDQSNSKQAHSQRTVPRTAHKHKLLANAALSTTVQ